MATSILNGKRIDRDKRPFQSQSKKEPTHEGELYDRMMADMRSLAKEQVTKELQAQITAVNKQAKLAEEANQAARSALAAAEKTQQILEGKNTELTTRVEELVNENERLRSNHSLKVQNMESGNSSMQSQIREMEQTISRLQGQLEQAKTMKTETKIVQSTPTKIPSFKATPIRDGAGELVGANIEPIGGH